MAYTSRTDAWEVVCPNCGAQVGEKCVGARGKKRESVHRERMNAAARALGHPPIATFRIDGHKLYDAEGQLVGHLSGVEFDLQSEALVGNLRRGESGGAVDVPQIEGQPLSQEGSAEGPAQQALLDDPVREVWDHYQQALERPKAQLTPKVRRWISDALQAVGVDECKRAIDGLAASEHHRQGGYVGIEYALKPKERETIEGRIAMMAAKAPTGANGQTTVDSLVARLPSEVQTMVRSWITDVEVWLRSPEHRGLKATAEARLRELRDKAHMVPVIEDGRIVRWERP